MARIQVANQSAEEERQLTVARLQVASPDADLVLQQIVDEVRAIFAVDLCLVNIALEDVLFFRAWSGNLPAPLAERRAAPREPSLCQHVVTAGNPLVITDLRKSDNQAARALHQSLGIGGYAGVPITTSANHVVGTLCLLHGDPIDLDTRDVTLLEAYARAVASRLELISAVRRTRAAFGWMSRSSRDMFVALSTDGIITEANYSAAEATGYSPEELAGRHALRHVFREDVAVVREMMQTLLRQGLGDSWVHRLIRKDGSVVWVEWYPTCQVQDDTIFLCGRDVTARRRNQTELWMAAHYDSLTGLPNRLHFTEQLEGVIARRTACGEPVAVLFIDLDDFKLVNDSIGHEVGDRLLQEASARLAACVGAREYISRVGGDEFLVLVDGVLVAREPDELANAMLEALNAPFWIDGHQVYTKASIGMAVTTSPLPAGELIRQADVAMHSAKQSGKGSSQRFAPGMMRDVVRRLHLSTQLRRAEEQAEFRLVYQPLVSLATGRTEGVEALIRWHPPDRPEVSPADFIPVAEMTGAILPIGEWVLREACRQVQEWSVRFGRPIWVSVNLSPRQFQDPNLLSKVKAALAETGLPPALLKLEITESALILDVAGAVATLRDLLALGIRIGIDDFGTGYSSLSYLQQLPVNFLKIDRSFIRQLESDRTGQELVRAIVMLARALSLQVIAEGVETGHQAELLREIACDMAQGYYYERPLPPVVFAERYLQR